MSRVQYPPQKKSLDEETVAKYEDLDNVGDLRPLMELRPEQSEPAPIDTPDLLAGTGISSIELEEPPPPPFYERLWKRVKEKMFPTKDGQAPRSLKQNGFFLLICGALCVLGVGLLTWAILVIVTGP